VNEKAWIAFIAACILLIAALSIRRDDSRSMSPPSGTKTAVPTVEPSAVPLVTGEEPIADQFIRAGCPVCHTITGIAGANGQVGPPLLLGKTGRARLADPHYAGRAKTVREYIVESIVAPQEYIVPGYPERTMPPWYGSKLSAAALDQMAAYLEGITDMAEPVP
jgi:mono/diheme cytochrome c family protein